LHEQSKKRNLSNVEFLPFMNKEEIKKLLNVTDAAYISFANKPILETNSPNKFFDALASGKMVVTNTKGWIRDLSEENKCGFYINPEKPIEFADKITPFIENKQHLRTFQKNARNLGERNFSKNDQIEKLASLLV